jgi:hypothetical protein
MIEDVFGSQFSVLSSQFSVLNNAGFATWVRNNVGRNLRSNRRLPL